jgi:hypothetical protein
MKKLVYLLVGFLLTGATTFATNTNANYSSIYSKGYGNSFIFVEQGVEFAVFPDGQFDFNVDQYSPNFSAYSNYNGVSISYNTGHSYDAYVQYDDFGAVVQIENVPIYYDYYGRISQAGNIHINYNNRGYVSRVGGLYVHYNRYNRYSHYTGYINIYNRHYVYRPWHTYYVIPRVNLCVVFHKPYRQYYNPYRYTYYRPYRDNYRPHVSYTYNRRGNNKVASNRSYRSDRYKQTGPRGERAKQTVRPSRNNSLAANTNANVRENSRQVNTRENTISTRPQSRENTNGRIAQTRPSTREDFRAIKPRENTKSTKPKVRGNSQSIPNTSSTERPRTEKPRINQSQQRPNITSTQKPRTSKPKQSTVTRQNNRKTHTVTQRPTTSRPSKARVSQSKSSKPKTSRFSSSSRSTKRSKM